MYVFVEEKHIVIYLLGGFFVFVFVLPILDAEIYVEAKKRLRTWELCYKKLLVIVLPKKKNSFA